ncbi:MAG: hypothetical protein ABFS12_11205 [Bacteroidota bacterium]
MKNIITYILSAILLISANLYAQENNNAIILSDNSVKSIGIAIQSDNDGLKKSAMLMIGKHKLNQPCCLLIEQYGREKNMDYRYLIARVIYMVGCDLSVEKFRTVLKEEEVTELKYFCELLDKNYQFAQN